SDHHAAFAGGLCGPAVDLVVRDRALAVPAARPRAWAGRRFLFGGHTLCGAFLSEGEPRVRYGIFRRRHRWRGTEHVRRSVSGQQLWLAISAESLCGYPSRHRRAVLGLLRPRPWCGRRLRTFDDAATGGIARSSRLEVLPILLDRIWRVHGVVSLDAAIFQERIRFLNRPSVAARCLLFIAWGRISRRWRVVVGSFRSPQCHLVGAVGGVDPAVPSFLSADRAHRVYRQWTGQFRYRAAALALYRLADGARCRICLRHGVDLQIHR